MSEEEKQPKVEEKVQETKAEDKEQVQEATETEEVEAKIEIDAKEKGGEELNKKEEEIKTKEEKRGSVEEFDVNSWQPKTEVGKKVKECQITDIDELLNMGICIKEPEIVWWWSVKSFQTNSKEN